MIKRFRSIYTKVLIGCIALLIVLSTIFTAFFIYQAVKIQQRDLIRHHETLAEYVSHEAELGVLSRNSERLSEIAERFLRDTDVTGILFYDTDGKLITGKRRSGMLEQVLDPQWASGKRHSEFIGTLTGEGKLTVIVPVYLDMPASDLDLFLGAQLDGNRVVTGWLRTDVSGAAIEREKIRLIETGIAIALFVTLVFAVILYRFLAREVGQPLHDVKELMLAVRELGQGGAVRKINSTFANEIGILAGEFNRMSEAVREREEELRKLARAVECAGEAIVIAKGDGKIVYTNPAFKTITGYESDEVAGKSIYTIIASDSSSNEYRQLAGALATGTKCMLETQNRKKDGAVFLADEAVFPIFDDNNRVIYSLFIARDITEKDRLEKSLIQAQKMESIGVLAGGIAHDFNNLLGGMMGYTSLLKVQCADCDKEVIEHLDMIENLGRRAAKTTQQLLGFAHLGKYRAERIDLNALAVEIHDFLAETVDRRISFKLGLKTPVPFVLADGNQIYQVILNLCINSRDAMPEGGAISIDTSIMTVAGSRHTIYDFKINPGCYAMVAVSDTGTGMEEKTMAKIFEPFFTTKETGKGTGLGLAMVYGIVKNHGGFVEVSSTPGRGTRVSVYLPIAGQE